MIVIRRVLSVHEKKEFKNIIHLLTPAMVMKLCMEVKVCIPGVFPLIFLPRSRWSTMTLGWLGQEVGCTLNPGVNLKEIREDGVEMPETMVVRMRNGGLLNYPHSY